VIALRDGYQTKKLDGVMNIALEDAVQFVLLEVVYCGRVSITSGSCLIDIQTKMDGWVHIGKLQSFTKQKSIEAQIEHCLSAVSDCLMKFQVHDCI